MTSNKIKNNVLDTLLDIYPKPLKNKAKNTMVKAVAKITNGSSYPELKRE